MNKEELERGARQIFAAQPGNSVPELAGLVIFEPPLMGVASAKDPLFSEYKKPEVIGPHHMSPEEWLPGAESVLSFFFPFTARVREAERAQPFETSTEWLYGRVEGQNFISAFTEGFCQWLRERDIQCCAPSRDERFCVSPERRSNWSERHAAYACGLGSFGLSRGIITKKGMAGRFTSVIINTPLEPDRREYSGLYDACVLCGACIRRCPAKAISFEKGKDHGPCAERLAWTRKEYAPRYGCGKCQTAVPCEARDPSRPLQTGK